MRSPGLARRLRSLKEMGCIACRKYACLRPGYAEIHHLNIGGVAGAARRGDWYTVPLCRWHHRGEPIFPLHAPSVQTTARMMGPSLKLTARQFRETFGEDDALLAEVNAFLEAAHGEASTTGRRRGGKGSRKNAPPPKVYVYDGSVRGAWDPHFIGGRGP